MRIANVLRSPGGLLSPVGVYRWYRKAGPSRRYCIKRALQLGWLVQLDRVPLECATPEARRRWSS